MPVRIYDISKKLGLENKEVLAKAKALGIAAARVASSSLDKITAEYLEQQIILEHPNLAAPQPPPPATAPAPANQPILVVTAPPPQTATAPQPADPPAPLAQPEAPGPVTAISQPPPSVEPAPIAKAPPPPPPPVGPKVGDK